MDKEVTDLKKGVEDLEEQKELLLNDTDWLNDELCKKGEYMDNIEEHIHTYQSLACKTVINAECP